ncbi:hypothetical protein [uncultured Thiohalocapsa sp.]|uniref:hypothetical protein n=1 Tax=uncultured Thiohalocapsa sp. TaxID=768990 RepID=UPI0025F0E5C0|nr:hypothetical protein [uncultured Thiohalocapsa sp.]
MSDLNTIAAGDASLSGIGGPHRRPVGPPTMSPSGEAMLVALETPPVDALKTRIADMVRSYVTRRSPQLARRIAHASGALALHPALRNEPDQRMAFCRLHRHWHLLAAQYPATAGA